MNAQFPAPAPHTAAAPAVAVAADSVQSAGAFTSVTIWGGADYFVQVHYGYFNSWEDAEDFAAHGNLRLETRSNALFLVGPHGAAFIPDQAMTVFRNLGNSFDGGGTYDMTFDDLIEVAEVEDMRLSAIGSLPVTRGRPIIARHISKWDVQATTAAANDE